AWKAHAYAWIANLANMHPRLDVLLGVAPSFSSQAKQQRYTHAKTCSRKPRRGLDPSNLLQSLRIGVEDQAYAWKQVNQLQATQSPRIRRRRPSLCVEVIESSPKHSRPTHRRGSPRLCVEVISSAQSLMKPTHMRRFLRLEEWT
ncbi:hypothetical protein PIB30_094022, partial [Stylosanthes scabra]|nr:hypothetical protein [Stylosanthes scabra]